MSTSTTSGVSSLVVEQRSDSFRNFVLQPAYRKYLYIALVGIAGQLILFKLLYPFADYFSDSYSFIEIAITREGFNIWPIGYSWFLYLFHFVTHSDTAVVVFQYVFLQVAILTFFFTILYWYPLSPTATAILFVVLLFNPLLLYVSNYISSDALFSALSILWLTLLLWMLHRPRNWQLWAHGLVLVVAFTIRYHAMYYPLVTLVVFLLSRFSRNAKIAGLAAPIVLILAFVQYTRDEAYRLTGVHQFSVLTDWHWANNALYMYEHITVDTTQVPYEAHPFQRMTQAYFDTIPDEWRNFTPRIGGIYFRHPYGPLKTYMRRYRRAHPEISDIEGWGQVAPVYGIWGKHMIKKHPLPYVRYYILPNTLNYFLPPLEKLVTYNYGGTEVPPIVAQWFDYPGTEVRVASKDLSNIALLFVPMIFMMLNVAFVAGAIWFMVRRHWREMPVVWQGLMLAMIVWGLNTAFNIIAAPVAVRYLIFPFVVFTGFAAVLMDMWVRESEGQSTVDGPQSTVNTGEKSTVGDPVR